jgi:serine/threonine protein kinase
MSRALGRYELLRPLARGGMGEVYLARRRAAGVEKWLVVKRMRPEKSGDTRFLDLFMREAKLSMSLAHQNIVPVFDFGRIDDQVFLAMERVEGKDLGSSLAKASKGLPPLLAAFIAAECLQALDYAHRRKSPDGVELGIVHRDVTPRNVLLSWSGEVKLTDFGIAALAGDSPSRTAGTPAYMAPEQARGEQLDVRADIYAVGLVLREALTGERARRGNERETVLAAAKQGTLDPLPDSLDPTLRGIVERATQLDRASRYPDARSMLEELDSFIVAERAAKKVEAPSRQLGAWLTDVWKDTRDDEGALDAQIEAGVLVSFLDDGPLDVIGSGTQRSALATAADEASIPSGPSEKIEVSPELSTAASATSSGVKSTVKPGANLAAPSDAKAAQTTTKRPDTAEQRRRSPVLLAVLGGALAVAAIAIVVLLGRDTGSSSQVAATGMRDDAAPVAVATADAGAALDNRDDAGGLAAGPADAAELVEPSAIVDAGSRPLLADAGVRQRPVPPPTPRDAAVKIAVDAAAAAVAPPTGGKRKVTINSKPWSDWTVDGGAKHSGLETIELAPGAHTIHFTGNPYFKADKTVTITVPDRDGFTYVEKLEAAPAP